MDEWFDKESKSLFKMTGILFAAATILSFGLLAGLIWFTVWCLKSFGVIG